LPIVAKGNFGTQICDPSPAAVTIANIVVMPGAFAILRLSLDPTYAAFKKHRLYLHHHVE